MLRIPTAPPTHAPYYFHKGNGKSMVIRRSRSPWMNGIKEGSDRDFVDDEPLPLQSLRRIWPISSRLRP